MAQKITIILKSVPEGGYFSYCAEIPGSNGQGETVEDCTQNLAEAILLIQRDILEDLS